MSKHPWDRSETEERKIRFSILPDNIAFNPIDCLKRGIELEKAGFNAILEGDHVLPIHDTDGHCTGALAHMGVLLANTKKCQCGVMVFAPSNTRWHPTQLALELASLALFYGGERIIFGVGTGEAVNCYAATGFWPSIKERQERVIEAIQLIKKCFTAKDYITHKGKYFNTPLFKLYDMPETGWPPPILMAASGPKTAYYAGKHCEGIVMIASPEIIKSILLPQFEKGARESGKNPELMEKAAFVSTAYHPKDPYGKAKYYAGFLFPELYGVIDPRIWEARSLMIKESAIKATYNIAQNADDLIEGFDRYVRVGVNSLIWDEISPDPWLTTKIFREKVKAWFAEQYGMF